MPAHSSSAARPHQTADFHIRWRTLFVLIVTGAVVYLVAAGFSGLHRTLHVLQAAHPLFLLPAVVAVAGSYACAALTYCLLAEKRLAFGPTLVVQISGGLANRLLPGGLGGLGINAWYLAKRGHTATVASVIVAINNGLGFIGNLLLLLITVTAPWHSAASFSLPHVSPVLALIALAAAAGLALLLATPLWRQRLSGAMREAHLYIRAAVHRPGPTLAAVMSSMALTSLHVLALLCVSRALGIHPGWQSCLYAISAGAFAGAVVPTPGGLGGAEAGIAGLLTAAGVAPSSAISTALLYRFITYWLPLLPGYVALRMVEKQYL